MSNEILSSEICDGISEADLQAEPVNAENSEEILSHSEEVSADSANTEEESNTSEDMSESAEEMDAAQQTVESLRAELETLRIELIEKRAAFERMSGEICEFSELFPTVSISSIPDSVWQSVRSGIPLAASYALYEKKTGLLLADAKQVNQKNSALSTGPLGKESTSDFFSPDEVRAMSRDEVRKNYSKIMESMKKWN